MRSYAFWINLGISEFTGNLCLTETASGNFNAVLKLFRRADGVIAIFITFIFVMPLGGDGSSRAAGRTDLAGSVKKEETVGLVVRIFFSRRFERQIGDYTSHPHGFPLGSDKSIAQPKSAKPANIGGMALGRAGRQSLRGEIEPSSQPGEFMGATAW